MLVQVQCLECKELSELSPEDVHCTWCSAPESSLDAIGGSDV